MTRIAGQSFQQGQHICVLYQTQEEQLAVAAEYVADGLRQNEQCLYVSDSADALDCFRCTLAACGADVRAAEASGALLLLTSDRAHLIDGRFDSERMLRILNDAVENALDRGFAGLRTCGDMSWLLDGAQGSHQVVEYEAVLNQFFNNVRGVGMCQYDCRRLPAELLSRAGIAAHSSIVIDNAHKTNPLCKPAALAATATRETLEADLAALRRS